MILLVYNLILVRFMARPEREIKWDVVLMRMQAGNTAAQIAQAHNINIDTFYDRFKKEFGCGFSDYSDPERTLGKGNIAYVQYTKALQGSTAMLSLLGEEWLGQGAPKPPTVAANQPTIDYQHEIMQLQNEIANLRQNGITSTGQYECVRNSTQSGDNQSKTE